ncbi:MAG: radical SAM protein, partial [Gemmatimonadetes bacterium]|nr:radical SAM protein [Gemmatimonadota bacterium]
MSDDRRSARARSRDLPVFPLAPAGPGTLTAPRAVDAIGSDHGTRVSLVTLGCDKNTVDSERILAALLAGGARVSPDPADADVVLINTCGFIEAAKEESIETLLEACQLKETRGVRAVVAVGCLVQRYKADLERELPEVDLFLGLSELDRLLPELTDRGLLEQETIPLMERPLRVLTSATPHTTYLKISEGCDHTCAFCAIPSMRGLHRSAPLDALVEEAALLGRRGVKELNVISQDTTWYGRDLRRRIGQEAPLLPDLLRALLEGTDVPWYRLFYMYPSGLTRDLVDLMASQPRILPYLDMPL